MAWRGVDTEWVTDLLAEKKPKFLILDLTEAILYPDIELPIEEASSSRRNGVLRIATHMKDHPEMLYIIINPNPSRPLNTSVSIYEKMGIADRYIFVKNRDEAIATIRQYQSRQ